MTIPLDADPVVYRGNGGGGNRTRVAGRAEKRFVQEFRFHVASADVKIWQGTPTSLYVVEEDDGPLKIGIARDPEERLATLQIGNPRPLRLVCAFPASLGFERIVHSVLVRDRIVSEWFQPSPHVLAVVEELASVTEICQMLSEQVLEDEERAQVDDVRELFSSRVEDDIPRILRRARVRETRRRRLIGSSWLNLGPIGFYVLGKSLAPRMTLSPDNGGVE